MNCPKNMLTACFYYLERVFREDKLVDDLDVDKIVKDIKRGVDGYVESQIKSNHENENLPHDNLPMTIICSKDTFSSINYIEALGNLKQSQINSDTNFMVDTKYDVVLSVDTTFIPSDSMRADIVEEEKQKIILEQDETEAILCLSSTKTGLEATLMNSFNAFFEHEDIDYASVSKFCKAIVASTAELKPQELIRSGKSYIKLLEMNLEEDNLSLINDIAQSLELHPLIVDNLDVFFKHFKDTQHEAVKNILTKLPLVRGEGIKQAYDFLVNKGFYSENQEFFDALSKKESFDLEVKFKTSDNYGVVYSKKNKDAINAFVSKMETSRQFLSDSLIEKQIEKVIPSEIIINLTDSQPKVSLDFSGSSDVEFIKETSLRASKSFFYTSDFITEKKAKCLALDEVDVGIGGEGAKVARKVAGAAESVIIGTGSPTNGKPEKSAYLIGFSGELTNEEIEQLSVKFNEQCGINEIKNSFLKTLFIALNNSREMDRAFKDCANKYMKSAADKEGASNVNKIAEEFTKIVINFARENELGVEDTPFLECVSAVKNTMKIITKKENFIETANLNGLDTFKFALFADKAGSGILSRQRAGIEPIGSYVNLMRSQNGNQDLTTREKLFGIKETVEFPNYGKYLETREKIAKKEIDVKEVKKSNYLGSRLTNEYLRKKNVIEFTTSISYFLKTNFNNFMDSATNSGIAGKKNLQLITPDGTTPKEFLSIISKSGMSRGVDTDSMSAFYSEYLSSNGEIPKHSDEKKVEAFIHVLKMFDKYFIKQEFDGVKDGESFVFNQVDIPEKFYNTLGDELILKSGLSFVDCYPYREKAMGLEKCFFSIDTVFDREEWRAFVKPIEYKYSLTNSTEKDIMDTFASRGRIVEIGESIDGGEKFLLTNNRTIGTIINIYDTVYQASLRQNKEALFSILAVKTPEGKKAIESIDPQFLAKHNINIETIDANSLAGEVKKYNSKKIQYAIISNYKPTSRGLDLSELDRIIGTGAKEDKNTGIQEASRTMNPSLGATKAVLNLFQGGEDVDINIPSSLEKNKILQAMKEIEQALVYDANGALSFINDESLVDVYNRQQDDGILQYKPTYSNLINQDFVKALRVYSGVMNGTLADKLQTNPKEFITMSDSYQTLLQAQSSEYSKAADINQRVAI